MIFGDSAAPMRAAQAEADRVRAADEAEEEGMTPYSAKELAEGWEFKIIRSPRKLFGQQEYRERVLAEERRAGWVLVEVFDDGRIRLRRRRPSGVSEQIDGYDPYRTTLNDWKEPVSPAQRAAPKSHLGVSSRGCNRRRLVRHSRVALERVADGRPRRCSRPAGHDWFLGFIGSPAPPAAELCRSANEI